MVMAVSQEITPPPVGHIFPMIFPLFVNPPPPQKTYSLLYLITYVIHSEVVKLLLEPIS